MRDLPSIRVSVVGSMAVTMVAVSVGVSSSGIVAAAQGSSSSVTPTPLEQAVMEHNCRVPGQAMLPADLLEVCLRDQLTYLRAEFGKDLRKLSAGERGAIDRACSALRVERGRDEYVACLSDRLTRVTRARGRAVPSVPTAVANAAGAPTLASGSPEMPVGDTSGPATSDPLPAETSDHANGNSLATWLGGLVVVLCGVGAWGLMARRRPKAALAFCRVCGEPAQRGDLCATCRHEAADAQRRAAAERPEAPSSTPNDHARRPEVQTGGVARAEATVTAPAADMASTATTQAAQLTQAQALESRRREQEQTVQARIEREREEARAQEAERRRWQQAAAAAIAEESPIDPRSVLGVGADATPEQIHAAYEQAKQKYSPDLVSHLGSELQDLYRTKAQAVERAYQLLR